MNCTLEEYLNTGWNGGAFREEPTREVIEEFARYNGLDVGDTKVAEQYFNKSDNSDRICDTCIKEDVCMYKGECAQAAKDISLIAERKNVFIDTDIKCKKWSGEVSNYRGLKGEYS